MVVKFDTSSVDMINPTIILLFWQGFMFFLLLPFQDANNFVSHKQDGTNELNVTQSSHGVKRLSSNEEDDISSEDDASGPVLPTKRQRKVTGRFLDSSFKGLPLGDVVSLSLRKIFMAKLKADKDK